MKALFPTFLSLLFLIAAAWNGSLWGTSQFDILNFLYGCATVLAAFLYLVFATRAARAYWERN